MSANELIQIRRFHPRDLDDAARAANSACRQAYAFFGYSHPVTTTLLRLLEALEEGQDFWIAEVAGAVAGIMTLMPNFIDKLFLAPHHQALGLGSAMISKAKSLHPDYLELHCAQQNYGACRFYEHHAFRPVTYRLDDMIGIPEIVYRWNGA
jgi:GNAT superfamily N-acetyltransferase